MQFEIKNIKISLKVNEQLLNNVEKKCVIENLICKRKNNFLIIKDNFIYTLFLPSKNKTNHVNITKIPNTNSIALATNFLSEKLNLDICEGSWKIDNITATLDLGTKISILKLLNNHSQFHNYWKGTFAFSYCNEKFPGLFIKVKSKEKLGTIIIFSTGKVVFVGCKSVEDIKCLASLICAFTKMK